MVLSVFRYYSLCTINTRLHLSNALNGQSSTLSQLFREMRQEQRMGVDQILRTGKRLVEISVATQQQNRQLHQAHMLQGREVLQHLDSLCRRMTNIESRIDGGMGNIETRVDTCAAGLKDALMPSWEKLLSQQAHLQGERRDVSAQGKMQLIQHLHDFPGNGKLRDGCLEMIGLL